MVSFVSKSHAIVALTLLSLYLVLVEASCPNKCSGHGACGANDVCECKQNWMGGDCSLRVCPYTRAWVDVAQNANDAHFYAECGNKGSCDRTTGICVCDAGYTGSGCRRQACPQDCSGHGTCEFIDEFTTSSYTLWDQEKIMGCKCDPGFEGHDCASKICPKGDDPVTSHEQNGMEQYIHYVPATTVTTPAPAPGADTADYGDIYLEYVDPYGNTWTTSTIRRADLDVNAAGSTATFCASVETALRAIPNLALKDVRVTSLATSDVAGIGFALTRTTDAVTSGVISSTTAVTIGTADKEHACKIIFPAAAGTSGLQNIISCKTAGHIGKGSQPLITNGQSSATCSTGEFATSAAEGDTLKLTELATCSNRGLCDGATGDCQCFAGHRGLACETQEALV